MNNPKPNKNIRLSPGMMAVMNRMVEITEADDTVTEEYIAEFEAMSREQRAAELKASGIDFTAFKQRLQKTIDDFRQRPTVIQRLADGIEKLLQGSRAFLRLTQEGLDDLRATFAPATLRAGGGALAAAIEAAGIEVVALSLAMKPEGVQLMLRWLRDIPVQPPTVTVTVASELRSVRVEWPGWDGVLERAQRLRLVDCGIDAATWAAATQAEKPLLLYRWERETNQLHVELLPLVETA